MEMYAAVSELKERCQAKGRRIELIFSCLHAIKQRDIAKKGQSELKEKGSFYHSSDIYVRSEL